MSACQSASNWVVWHTASCFTCLFNILNSVGESPPVFTWCNMKGFDLLRTIRQPAHFHGIVDLVLVRGAKGIHIQLVVQHVGESPAAFT